MKAQEVYLSPRSILRNLRLIEAKVRRPSFEIYTPPQAPAGGMSDLTVSQEAQKMFDFAGLADYKVQVSYTDLEEGIGGQILLNHDRTVSISISNSYKNNWAATLAVLAHEICHKVLFVNGLTLPTTLLNEIYTDLTTIYVGFGQLILNGCVTQQEGITHFLGYLTVDTYKVTHLLVCAIFGKMTTKETGYETVDPFASEALKRWESVENKEEALAELYIKRSYRYISFVKDIQRLEQILKHCKTGLYHQLGQVEEAFFADTGSSWDGLNNKLATFAVIYEQCVWENEVGTAELPLSLMQMKRIVSNTTYDLFIKYQEFNHFEFHNAVSCPFCGETVFGKRADKDIYVEKCTHCGKHFVYDGSAWNPTSRQREIRDEEEARQQLFNHEVDRARRSIQADADKQVQEIRLNEQNRCKESIRKSIPRILFPFVKKYLQ